MSQQPQTTTLSELKKPVPPLDPSIKAGFDTVGGFDLIQRTAKLFAASNIVPQPCAWGPTRSWSARTSISCMDAPHGPHNS